MKHLLSESGSWLTNSEFVAADGSITIAKGMSVIFIEEKVITNESWAQVGNIRRKNNYRIISVSNTEYTSKSINPELGNQVGIFNVDRNTLYFKFRVEKSSLSGFEIIRREGNTCYVNGALYDQDNLINTWTAIMTKEEQILTADIIL